MTPTMRARYIYAIIRVNNAVDDAAERAHIDLAKLIAMARWRVYG